MAEHRPLLKIKLGGWGTASPSGAVTCRCVGTLQEAACMSLAERIAVDLPRLRRFARLLAGSQQAGDAAVTRLLETIVADPGCFPDLPVRVGLYQVFLSAFTTGLYARGRGAELLGKTAARSLAALPSRTRQAFLLTSVEEFDLREAAQILEVSERAAEELIRQAGEEIGRQIATDVLIIEDEPLIALDLQKILQGLGHEVTSIARTRKDALKAVSLKKPGLVLADIRLADGSSGLDAVNDLLESFAVPVIFVTAYPEKLMTGERPEPTFLITKPFREDAVKAIVSQVLFFDQDAVRRR
jgi:CheY-like chemotaxis protein/DNA-directed RNA polymerase specialized sigma24 family protein